MNAKCKMQNAKLWSRLHRPLTSSLFPRSRSSEAASIINLKINGRSLLKTCSDLPYSLPSRCLRGKCHAVTDEDYNLQSWNFIPTSFAGENYLSAEISPRPQFCILPFAFCILFIFPIFINFKNNILICEKLDFVNRCA